MPKCIYCLQEKEESFFNKEHVIPQAFGKFGSETPTLVNCVCQSCNEYFASVLDPVFTRDTYEGITRHVFGLKSRESRPQQRVQLVLPDEKEYGNFRNARAWLDGKQNGLVVYSQAGFLDEVTGKRQHFTYGELKQLDNLHPGLSTKNVLVLAQSQMEHDEIIELLKEKGFIDASEKRNTFSAEEIPHAIKPEIRGTVDKMVRRSIAKVAMNFVAKYVGAEEVVGDRWKKARGFIRYGEGEIAARASNKPFWGSETQHIRIGPKEQHPDAIYNIRVENQKEGIVVVLEFCHIFLHEILLVEGEYLDESEEVAFAFIPGSEPITGKKFRL